MDIIKGLEEFFINSKILGLAVAVVFGSVFKDVIQSIVKELIMKFKCPSAIKWSLITESFITFILSIIIMYILVVLPLTNRIKKNDYIKKKEEKIEDSKAAIETMNIVKSEVKKEIYKHNNDSYSHLY